VVGPATSAEIWLRSSSIAATTAQHGGLLTIAAWLFAEFRPRSHLEKLPTPDRSGVIFPDLLIAQKSLELSKIDRIDFSMLYFLYFLVPIFDYTDPQ
jgi:hypothetical protein